MSMRSVDRMDDRPKDDDSMGGRMDRRDSGMSGSKKNKDKGSDMSSAMADGGIGKKMK
ncbi:MAG: hypothetical protein LBV13_01955 [Methanomassiliicoccaceae archaeon]|nr:hypothetical protein [Methanomassiliicoccaceae archaeon]